MLRQFVRSLKNDWHLLYQQPYRLMYLYVGVVLTIGTITGFDPNRWFSEVFDIIFGAAMLYATFLRGLGRIYIIIALMSASAYGMLAAAGLAFGKAPIESAIFLPIAAVIIYSGVRQLRMQK